MEALALPLLLALVVAFAYLATRFGHDPELPTPDPQPEDGWLDEPDWSWPR